MLNGKILFIILRGSTLTCNICGKEKAVLHITEQRGGEFEKISICKKCNEELRVTEKCLEYNDNEVFSVLTKLPNHKSVSIKKVSKSKKRYKKVCNVCGYSLSDFLESKTAACPKCHNSFGAFVDKMVKKIHRSNKHTGKISNRNLSNEDIENEISRYKDNMELLKKMERYEEANELKKKIESLNEALISKKSEKIEEKI